MSESIQQVILQILSDIRVDLGDQFDQNFQRQGFFEEKWQRRKSPIHAGRPILISTGQLRRSVRSRSDDKSITFYSDLPYASIHNEGGKIKVTARMKDFFWYKYYEAQGSMGRKKNGELRQNKRNARIGTEAEFWKAMALMKVGKYITIPKRQFLGYTHAVEMAVRNIIESNLTEYFNSLHISGGGEVTTF